MLKITVMMRQLPPRNCILSFTIIVDTRMRNGANITTEASSSIPIPNQESRVQDTVNDDGPSNQEGHTSGPQCSTQAERAPGGDADLERVGPTGEEGHLQEGGGDLFNESPQDEEYCLIDAAEAAEADATKETRKRSKEEARLEDRLTNAYKPKHSKRVTRATKYK